MILLLLLPFILVYVFLLFYVPARFSKYSKARNFSKAKRWGLTFLGFLLVYLPVFWDHIPTVVAHNYYCGKDAGLFIYKTPEQWKLENPGVAETLIPDQDRRPKDREPHEKIPNGTRYMLNQRFASDIQDVDESWGISRLEESIIDREKQEVLVRYRSYSTGVFVSGVGNSGGLRGFKVWMQYPSCEDEEPTKRPKQSAFGQSESIFKRLGSKG